MGISMLMFGILKFFSPFKDWYTTQVTASELPFPSYPLGIAGEIFTGMLFIYVVLNFKKLTEDKIYKLILAGGALVGTMMVVAIYVHMHPAVPHDVLPLKIKPPIIPIVFALIAGTNVFMFKKSKGVTK